MAKPALPHDEALPREMLWVLAGAPPVLGALFWGQAYLATFGEMVETLAAIWTYTVALGLTMHLSFVRLAPALSKHNVPMPARVLAYAVLVCTLVTAMTLIAMPLLRTVSIASHVHPISISVRASLICGLYLIVGTTLARLRARAVHEALRADAQERVALEARFAALQARTNPHFLFNALNAVASLIAVDAERAERILEKLSSLFRYTLEGAERRTVPLSDELDAVRDYLEIETTRFGDRLTTEVQLDPEAASILVPPMIVQPLVENAIIHGLGKAATRGHVWVSAKCDQGGLVVSVEDDGVGPGGSTRKGTGTAVSGIRERLALAFGERASLETGPRDGGGFRAVLHLPRGGE
jgi:two-component system sensor histidine kinase AlgZ